MIGQEIVYGGGLHWVGISYALIRYPSVEVTLPIDLLTRTKEGLGLNLKMSIQFKFRQNKLP